ncbi:TetR/AcrR family transcriptional regulator [Nocardiopsis coralliicola]
MPRAGLDTAAVVAAGADLADETGLAGLTMGRLAQRLGVRAPSLYKHVAGQDELLRGIAALAMGQAADAMGAAIQGRAGRDALAAAAHAFRAFAVEHPGRYAATIGREPEGPDDPLAAPSLRWLDTFTAILRGYGVGPDDRDHALRLLRSLFHGFATLEGQRGFQWSTDVDASFEWLIAFTDRGLRSL